MSKALLIFAILFGLSLSVKASNPPVPQPTRHSCEAIKRTLRTGDLVFLSVENAVMRKISDTQLSWANHVGIAIDGQIADSSVPKSRIRPVCDFLKMSLGGGFKILRPKVALTEEQRKALAVEAKKRLGLFYGLGFDYNGKRPFCSKFVYDVYKAATGIEVGKLMTFRELLAQNPNAGLGFWKVYFAARGKSIPWDRVTITPGTQLVDEDFEVVNVQD